MNINFHYFTIKTLAMLAGFSDNQAQQIAQYSQFVDDFSAPPTMACSNIPKEIMKSDTLDLYISSPRGNFWPVSTGFTNPFEYATLIVRREQRFVLSPFHFAPFDKKGGGITDARVVPLEYGDGSLVDRLLQREILRYRYMNDETLRLPDKAIYQESNFDPHITDPHITDQNITLMRMGMLLHTFADTYAHQMFTGFVSPVNRVNITQVRNNITGEDTTAPAHAGIRGLFERAASSIPPIGHVQAGSNPDLSHVGFGFIYDAVADGYDGEGVYFRDNTEVFLEAALQVFRYLSRCQENTLTDTNNNIHDNPSIDTVVDNHIWDENKKKLRQGLLVEMPRRDTARGLAWHWGQIFPMINYHYDGSAISRGFRLAPTSISQMTRSGFTAFSDEFYGYNIMANEMLIELYGPRPRIHM